MQPIFYHANPLHGQVGIGTYLSGVRSGIQGVPDPSRFTPIEAAGRAWLDTVRRMPNDSIYFGTESYDFLPWRRRTVKQVVAVHDLLLTEPIGGGSRALQLKCRALVRRMDVVDRVLTLSSFVATALPSRLANRVVVAPPGVSASYETAAESVVSEAHPTEDWAVLAAVHPRKRVPFALEAFVAYRSQGGRRGLKVITNKSLDLPPGAYSVRAGDDRSLAMHLANSHALLYPSVAEGYGLPPVEAAYVGTPTLLVSDMPCAREEQHLQPFLVKSSLRAGAEEWGALMRETDAMRRPTRRLILDSRARWTHIVNAVAEVGG